MEHLLIVLAHWLLGHPQTLAFVLLISVAMMVVAAL